MQVIPADVTQAGAHRPAIRPSTSSPSRAAERGPRLEAGTTAEGDVGAPIRSVSRALSVLQAINRGKSLTLTEIAEASHVPYPTAYRLVQTLVLEGMIEREPSRKRYRPTALVETLSHGFHGHGALVAAARPHMSAFTRALGWPLSLTTHVGNSMVLRHSTHAETSLTFNAYHPGYALPILGCAAGLAYLGFVSDEERDGILDSLRYRADRQTEHMLCLIRDEDLLEQVRADAHATCVFNRHTENPGKTSSISVPVRRDGQVVGALTVAFFASAMSIDEGVRRLLGKLTDCAEAICSDLPA